MEALEDICKGSQDMSKCNEIIERYEDSHIYKWYKGEEMDETLTEYLCFKVIS